MSAHHSNSGLLGVPMETKFLLALMPLDVKAPGKRGGVTIFIGADRDWSDRHFQRHGGTWLATLQATQAAAEYRDDCPRAQRLNYRGPKPGDEAGMIEDLERLGYFANQIEHFTRTAKPFWPITP